MRYCGLIFHVTLPFFCLLVISEPVNYPKNNHCPASLHSSAASSSASGHSAASAQSLSRQDPPTGVYAPGHSSLSDPNTPRNPANIAPRLQGRPIRYNQHLEAAAFNRLHRLGMEARGEANFEKGLLLRRHSAHAGRAEQHEHHRGGKPLRRVRSFA